MLRFFFNFENLDFFLCRYSFDMWDENEILNPPDDWNPSLPRGLLRNLKRYISHQDRMRGMTHLITTPLSITTTGLCSLRAKQKQTQLTDLLCHWFQSTDWYRSQTPLPPCGFCTQLISLTAHPFLTFDYWPQTGSGQWTEHRFPLCPLFHVLTHRS